MGSFVRTSFKQHSQRNHTADVSYICWDLRVNEIDWLTSSLKQHTWFTAVNFVLNPAHHFSCQRNMSYVRNNVTVSAFTTADFRYSMGRISFISNGYEFRILIMLGTRLYQIRQFLSFQMQQLPPTTAVHRKVSFPGQMDITRYRNFDSFTGIVRA